MTETEILEGNKLIAEFMGISKQDTFAGKRYIYCIYNNKYSTQLHFNESWDWLMPVVEKIENLEFGKWYMHIQGNTVDIEDGNEGIGLWDFHINNEDPDFSLFPSNKKLKSVEAVYIAVVEFIKWYNNERKAIS